MGLVYVFSLHASKFYTDTKEKCIEMPFKERQRLNAAAHSTQGFWGHVNSAGPSHVQIALERL